MVSFLRKHLNSSNAIAIAAMCVALTSTATAAVVMTGADVKDESLTSADIKDGSVRGADILNRTVEVRDLSAAATTYLRETPAADRTALTDRFAAQTLATGETISGGFNIDTAATRAGTNNCDGPGDCDDFRVWVPFPIAAPSIPTVAMKTLDATCTGTVDAPTAPAGKVCVYVGGKSANADVFAIAGRATTTGTNSSLWVGAAAARRGFVVDLTVSGAAGDAFAVGSWAYTAP